MARPHKPAVARERRGPALAERGDLVLDMTVVLLDGGYASTAIGPIEVFHSAGTLWNWIHGEAPKPRFRVHIASIDGRPVTSMYGLKLTPTCAIGEIRHTNIVIVPTAGWDIMHKIAANTPLVAWLKKCHTRGAFVAGVCTGVAFLAEAGLLDGRQATTHWGVAEIMRGRYPRVRWQPEHFVTEDGRVLCSGGIYSSIDLSLYLVEKFCGREVALHSAKSLLLAMPRSRQSGYSVLPLSRPHDDDRIKAAEHYLHEHLRDDVPIELLAGQAGMGPRNFIRRFKAATGRGPGAYLQLLRIAAAKTLLERGAASVQVVCGEVGYDDAAFFRTLFKRHTGMTPAEYRDSFAQLSIQSGELAAGNG